MEDGKSVFGRCKMTKCEVFCMRSLRDSRKKRDHMQKYVAMYSSDTGMDWRVGMWDRLRTKVAEILGMEDILPAAVAVAPADP